MIYGLLQIDNYEELIKTEAYLLWLNGSEDHFKNWFDAKNIVTNRILAAIGRNTSNDRTSP
jgi:hypothetical protein